MIKDYNQNQTTNCSFKRRCIVPLLVLAICMISLTGEAYAYSSSVSEQSSISGSYYSIDMYEQIGENSSVVSKSLTSGDHFTVETSKIVGSNYSASVDETVITFYTKIKVTSDDSSDFNVTGTAKYVQNSGSADLYSAWAEDGAITCDVKVLGYNSGDYYDIEVNITLSEIDSVDLGTSDPRDIAEKVRFNGNSCIRISLSASN